MAKINSGCWKTSSHPDSSHKFYPQFLIMRSQQKNPEDRSRFLLSQGFQGRTDPIFVNPKMLCSPKYAFYYVDTCAGDKLVLIIGKRLAVGKPRLLPIPAPFITLPLWSIGGQGVYLPDPDPRQASSCVSSCCLWAFYHGTLELSEEH
jgi:hypothetical protein